MKEYSIYVKQGLLTYIGLGVIYFVSEPTKNTMKSTLYFPQLRPDNYFNIGNIIYISTLTGIKKFKIIEKKDPVFHCINEGSLSRQAFTYTSNEILSHEELCYMKSLINRVQDELASEECTPECIHELLVKKAKDGSGEFVLLFHRLDAMFVKQHIKIKHSLNFISQIMLFESPTTKQKTTEDPKDTIPMSIELKEELRVYVRSKNMSLSSYITDEGLNTLSFNAVKKRIDDLIEMSGKWKFG